MNTGKGIVVYDSKRMNPHADNVKYIEINTNQEPPWRLPVVSEVYTSLPDTRSSAPSRGCVQLEIKLANTLFNIIPSNAAVYLERARRREYESKQQFLGRLDEEAGS